MQNWNYFILEIAMFSTVALMSWQEWTIDGFRSRHFRRMALLLCSLWFALDQLALEAKIWWFPPEGTLPVRIARLPIEEYMCFIGHTAVTFLIVRLLETEWVDTKRSPLA
jgi:lycopene cyclase domain-containing protein